VNCLTKDARAKRLGRRATVMLGVVPPTPPRSVSLGLGLVPVATPSVKGGSCIEIGVDPLKYELGLVSFLGIGGLGCTCQGQPP